MHVSEVVKKQILQAGASRGVGHLTRARAHTHTHTHIYIYIYNDIREFGL